VTTDKRLTALLVIDPHKDWFAHHSQHHAFRVADWNKNGEEISVASVVSRLAVRDYEGARVKTERRSIHGNANTDTD
jgi:hypothetical protein